MTWQTPQGTMQADCYYLRAQISNTGNEAAESVELFLDEIRERSPNGSFVQRTTFLPMNLFWAHFRRPLLATLSPRLPKHCDVAHIIEPASRSRLPGEDSPALIAGQTALSLDLVVQPNTLSNLLPPGTYRLKFVLGAANAKPTTQWVEMVLTGQWFQNEQQMLSAGIMIRALDSA